jgi:predicted nuclease of predicted toxin-antitoxin system
MKIKLDENLGRRGSALFQAAGHDVDTVVDEGLATASDDAVRAAATTVGRVLVTLDTDFANPMRHPPAATPGIVVLRLPEPLTPTIIDTAVALLLAELGRENIVGRLWIVEVDRIRVYEPAD